MLLSLLFLAVAALGVLAYGVYAVFSDEGSLGLACLLTLAWMGALLLLVLQ